MLKRNPMGVGAGSSSGGFGALSLLVGVAVVASSLFLPRAVGRCSRRNPGSAARAEQLRNGSCRSSQGVPSKLQRELPNEISLFPRFKPIYRSFLGRSGVVLWTCLSVEEIIGKSTGTGVCHTCRAGHLYLHVATTPMSGATWSCRGGAPGTYPGTIIFPSCVTACQSLKMPRIVVSFTMNAASFGESFYEQQESLFTALIAWIRVNPWVSTAPRRLDNEILASVSERGVA